MIWPHDDTKSKNAFYGDFNANDWPERNLIHIQPPFKMYYEHQQLMHGILVHRKVADSLLRVFNDISDRCGHQQAAIDKTGASDFGGCFNIRRIAGSVNFSNHSWACAIDLSPNTNGFNTGHGTMDPLVIDAFKKEGWLWGGDYKGRTDPMHYEAVSR